MRLFLAALVLFTAPLANALAVSIYDIPAQFDKVVIQFNCEDGRVIRLVVPRKELEDPKTGDRVADLLQSQHCE